MEYCFHKLKPVKEIEPGWYILKWKPIKNGTWNLYTSKGYKGYRKVGILMEETGSHNGWGRSWDGFSIYLYLYWVSFTFWLHYNFMCMKDGPTDSPEQKLDFNL